MTVADRIRLFELGLADALAEFRNRHEQHILRIPHLVRGVTMAEFGDKYHGDVQTCLAGLLEERLDGIAAAPIDRTAMKRKWYASQESDVDGRNDGMLREGTAGGHEVNPAKSVKNRQSTVHRLTAVC